MPEIIALFLSFAALLMSVISCIFFYTQYLQHKKGIEKQALKEIEKVHDQSYSILQEATSKAQQIITNAENTQLNLVNNSKDLVKQLETTAEAEFAHDSKAAIEVMQTELKKYAGEVASVHQEFAQFITQLKSQSAALEQDTLQMVKEQTNNLFERFEQNLADFLSDTEQKTVSSIDLELKATRSLIDAYKQQQLRIIDDNIVAILEKTLTLVLNKKLTVNDQLDLIYEALEKAKLEKFIT